MPFFKKLKRLPWKQIAIIAGVGIGSSFAPNIVPGLAHVAAPAAQVVADPIAPVTNPEAQDLLTRLISAAVGLFLLWLKSPKEQK